MMTNCNATLYKRSVVSHAEYWERVEIKGPNDTYGVFWENRKAANVRQSGLISADRVSVYIPLSLGDFEIVAGDVMVKGIATEEISASYTITDLKKAYPNSIVVNSVDTMDFGSDHMQHVLIGGS